MRVWPAVWAALLLRQHPAWDPTSLGPQPGPHGIVILIQTPGTYVLSLGSSSQPGLAGWELQTVVGARAPLYPLKRPWRPECRLAGGDHLTVSFPSCHGGWS